MDNMDHINKLYLSPTTLNEIIHFQFAKHEWNIEKVSIKNMSHHISPSSEQNKGKNSVYDHFKIF